MSNLFNKQNQLATKKPISISFKATLQKFDENADKTGWTYFEIPMELAQQLKPDNKKSFRVKGCLDNHKISGVSILPMGGGGFIMPVNGTMRKAIKKGKGAMINVMLMVDEKEYQLNRDLVECLKDDPEAGEYFFGLAKSHQNYFSKWIDSAKTETTKTKRLSQTLISLGRKMDYGEMIRFYKGRE